MDYSTLASLERKKECVFYNVQPAERALCPCTNANNRKQKQRPTGSQLRLCVNTSQLTQVQAAGADVAQGLDESQAHRELVL